MNERERIEADASEALVDASDLVASGAGHPACVAPIVQLVLRERAAAFESAEKVARQRADEWRGNCEDDGWDCGNAIASDIDALAAQERAP